MQLYESFNKKYNDKQLQVYNSFHSFVWMEISENCPSCNQAGLNYEIDTSQTGAVQKDPIVCDICGTSFKLGYINEPIIVLEII